MIASGKTEYAAGKNVLLPLKKINREYYNSYVKKKNS